MTEYRNIRKFLLFVSVLLIFISGLSFGSAVTKSFQNSGLSDLFSGISCSMLAGVLYIVSTTFYQEQRYKKMKIIVLGIFALVLVISSLSDIFVVLKKYV